MATSRWLCCWSGVLKGQCLVLVRRLGHPSVKLAAKVRYADVLVGQAILPETAIISLCVRREKGKARNGTRTGMGSYIVPSRSRR